MYASGDTADQMVKMTLEGIEVAANITLKAGGSAAFGRWAQKNIKSRGGAQLAMK